MNSTELFMDVERFVEWTYRNSELTYKEEADYTKWSPNTMKKWRRYESLPLEKLNEINEKYLSDTDKPFEKINIVDLMLCCTLAKDHNRGKKDVESEPITSTGRKVLMIFLLGRMRNNDSKEASPFTVKESDNSEKPLYNYLSKDNITPAGVIDGLTDLVNRELVVCVDKENKLYKLSFEGCFEFLKLNKKIE